MKRLITIALALLICGAALAEAGGPGLRAGIAWGMTQEAVLAAEQPADYEVESRAGGAQVLEIEDMELDGVAYDLEYCFVSGVLTAMNCEFDAEDITPQALAERLDGQYGSRGAGDTGRFCALMGALVGGQYALTGELRDGDFFFDWSGPDGTYVALTNRLSEDGDDIAIFFFDAAALLDAGEVALSEPAPALED